MKLKFKLRSLPERLKQEPIGAALLSLASDSSVYLAGGVLIGLGNIVLVPLYTRTLSPREFGVYALIEVTVLLLVAISALKLDVSYLKWFADLVPSRRGELLGSTLLTGLSASLLGGLILSFSVAGPLGEFWLRTSAHSYAWLLCPIVILENLQALLMTDLRARRRPVPYSVSGLVRLVGMVVASYYFLSIRQMGLHGLFLGRLIGDALAVGYLSTVCLRSVVWKIVPSLTVPMIRFGLPLIWSVFAVMLQDASGRYFLSRYGTLEEVGLLAAAIKIAGVFQMLLAQPFGVAWGGVLFQIVKGRDAQIIYSKILAYVYVASFGVALILTVFAPTLFRIFTAPAYYSAIALLPLILLVRAMNVIEQPAATGIYLSGRTGIFAVIYSLTLALNLLLLYVLVPRYGAMGVAWAWLLAWAFVPILDLFVGQRTYRLSFNWKLALFPLLPWAFILPRLSPTLVIWKSAHLAIECALAGAVVLFTAALLTYDFRSTRRQARISGPVSPAWEAPSR
jgi:O-antigen/teichoic acid export membrane protein